MIVEHKRYRLVFLAIVLCLQVWSCEEDTVEPETNKSFEGILEVDVLCNIVGGDTTDFLPRPQTGPANYSLKYACPNPAQGKTTGIHWQIPQPDSVWILAYDRPGGPPVDTLYNRSSSAGSFVKSWTYDGPAGIYRIRMFTGSGFSSYGDVQLED